MRILELFLIAVLFLYAVSLLIAPRNRNRWIFGLPGAAMAVGFVHALVEGPRWQMVLLYVYTVAVFAIAAKDFRRIGRLATRAGLPDRRWRRSMIAAFAMILLAVFILPPVMFPVFRLPEPSGPFRVGTRRDHFVSMINASPDRGGAFDISVQTWYPAAEVRDARPARYWENAAEQSRIVAKFWGGLPPFLFSHLSLVSTRSFPNVPVSDAQPKFPVLIFNHGSLGLPSLHTALMEDLASHGYIVVSVGHVDYIPCFVLPDGRIRAFDPKSEEIRTKMAENNDPEVRQIFSKLRASRDLSEQRELLRRFLEKNPRNQVSLRRWAAEISFAVDRLQEMNLRGDDFCARMDFDRLGVLGVSFGGAAAVQGCLDDPRLKAAVNIDCPQFGDLLDRELRQPVLFIDSEPYSNKNDLFLESAGGPVSRVLVRGTNHQSFSDMGFWGSFFRKRMVGPLEPSRAQVIQNDYVRAFFDKYLKGETGGLLEGPSQGYPEVEVRISRKAV